MKLKIWRDVVGQSEAEKAGVRACEQLFTTYCLETLFAISV